MIYNNLRYCIIECVDIGLVHFNKVKETSPDTMRRSLDGTKTFVKYEGEQPDCLFTIAGNTTGLQEYTHEEILKLLDGPEWRSQY